MNHDIKRLGLVSEIELTPARFGPLNYHLLMGKKSNRSFRDNPYLRVDSYR